jgi:pimeloyl-ACP methyl ester carboxylesterase
MNMLQTDHRFAELAGDLTEGELDARPPIVLLHGLTFDRTMWGPALSQLERIDPGRRTLTLDLPGHGQSAEVFRGLDEVVAQLHAAVSAAGLSDPVYVGHSIGVMFAMLLAHQDGASGVVNVDGVLQVEPLFRQLETFRDQIYGDGFPDVWAQLLAGQHPELLPPEGETLVRDTSRPRQDIAIGYWQPTFEFGAAAAAEQVLVGIGAMRGQRIPYLIVAGSRPDDGYRAFLERNFPEAAVAVLPDSGHFPHVAHPMEFAELLASTGGWPASSRPPAMSLLSTVRSGPVARSAV